MQLLTYLRRIKRWDHSLHELTLVLVVVSAVSQVAANYLASRGPRASMAASVNAFLTTALHWVHWIAVGILMLYAAAYFVFSRRPGKELSDALPLPAEVPPSDDGKVAHGAMQVPYAYQGRGVLAEDIQFVTKTDKALAEIVYQMNVDGFQASEFELSLDEARTRDAAFIDRNGVAFLLLRDPNRETTPELSTSSRKDFIGYTCVLPLNEVGTDVYLRGLISDRVFPASLICGAGEPAASILVFAMYLEKEYRAKAVGQKYVVVLVRCIEEHIRRVVTGNAPRADTIDVWVQAEHESLRKHFRQRGFVETDRKSNEGFPLFKRSLLRPPAQPG